jgi:hypothetical protein
MPAFAQSSSCSGFGAPLTPQPPWTMPASTTGRPPRRPRGGTTLLDVDNRGPPSNSRLLGRPVVAAATAFPIEERSTSQPTEPSIWLNAISRPVVSHTATLMLRLSSSARSSAPFMIFRAFERLSMTYPLQKPVPYCGRRCILSLAAFIKWHLSPCQTNEFKSALRTKILFSKFRSRVSEYERIGRVRALTLLADQNISEDHGVIVQFVSRCVHKRNRTSPGHAAELPKFLGMFSELDRVEPAEFFPAIRVMCKPLPQFCAGGDLLAPLIDGSRLFAEPAGPEPIHQDVGAVLQ